MMLYHLDRRDTFVIPHWTEIYVIITVSTMVCEEIRKVIDTLLIEENSLLICRSIMIMIDEWSNDGVQLDRHFSLC